MSKLKISPFIEAVAVAEGQPTGLKWLIRVIRAGKSGNNNFYPDATLREATPMFDGVRVFVKSDTQHIQGQGKDFNQLIGQLSYAKFIEGQVKDSGEIQAVLTLLASAGDVPAKLLEAFDAGMSDMFGFSIDADATITRRGNLREANKFTKISSVDLIIEPGAGGELINMIEALNSQEQSTMSTTLQEMMIAVIKAANDDALPPDLDVNDAQAVLAAYNDALENAENEPGDNLTEADGQNKQSTIDATLKASTAKAKMTEALREAKMDDREAQFEARMALREAKADAKVLLNDCGLPEPITNKLRNQFADSENFTIEKVREAIKIEREVLAKMTESGHIVGLGDTHIEAGKDRADKIVTMMDDFFDPKKHAVSFRECYVEITGDRGVTGLIQNCDTRKLREALGGEESFREAISSSTFSNILGDSITRAMMRDYAALENYQDWRDLVDIVPVSDFRTQIRTRMGGYGNLPGVALNGGPYVALTSPTDEAATYAPTKRGGLETISLETIANDDVGAIRKVPQRLAVAAARTLYEFVMNFLATNPTIYDTTALFTVGHNNLGSTALSAASFAAARLSMKLQTELSSGKPLGLIIKHLYLPSTLEQTVYDLFVRGTNLDPTFVQSRRPTVHIVDYWSDSNNWFATADKIDAPLMEIGFYNGNEEPELFIQDLPTQGSLFSNDQIVYKIRHIYGGTILDFRPFYGAIVAG